MAASLPVRGAWRRAPLAALVGAALACAPRASSAQQPRPADVVGADAIIAALYDVISGPAGARRDWDRFRSLFIPGARLIPTGVDAEGRVGHRVFTPEEYAATVGARLEQTGFFERELGHVSETFGAVTHRMSAYDSRYAATDPAPFSRGVNSVQLLDDGQRWWVVSIYWAAERPGQPIPPRLLGAAARPAVAPDSTPIERARAAAGALGQGLMGRMLTQLSAHGAPSALSFCADSAQALTARYAAQGIDVRRTSLKPRNPRNAPDAMERAELEALQLLHGQGRRPPEVVRELDGPGSPELLYLRPIVVTDPCLQCHGSAADLAAGVADTLRRRYPADRATGYRAGDLRGAIVVRVRR